MKSSEDTGRAGRHAGAPCRTLRTSAALVAALVFAPVTLAREPGESALPAPSARAQIAASKSMTPAQRVATLEEMLDKETDRRIELDTRVVALTEENSRLISAQEALARDKASVASELARTRDDLARAQRDFESLRGEYTRIARIVGLSLSLIAPLALLIFALLGWLLVITRKLAVRVHDVPTLAKIQEYGTDVARLHDRINAEKSHNAVLRERLAKLGIVD
jgi:hypothetical protein